MGAMSLTSLDFECGSEKRVRVWRVDKIASCDCVFRHKCDASSSDQTVARKRYGEVRSRALPGERGITRGSYTYGRRLWRRGVTGACSSLRVPRSRLRKYGF